MKYLRYLPGGLGCYNTNASGIRIEQAQDFTVFVTFQAWGDGTLFSLRYPSILDVCIGFTGAGFRQPGKLCFIFVTGSLYYKENIYTDISVTDNKKHTAIIRYTPEQTDLFFDGQFHATYPSKRFPVAFEPTYVGLGIELYWALHSPSPDQFFRGNMYAAGLVTDKIPDEMVRNEKRTYKWAAKNKNAQLLYLPQSIDDDMIYDLAGNANLTIDKNVTVVGENNSEVEIR